MVQLFLCEFRFGSIAELNRAQPWIEFDLAQLRYHGRWIDSVWKSRSHADALKENPINLNIF